MRLLFQGHLDLPQTVTLDVVLKDPHPILFPLPLWEGIKGRGDFLTYVNLFA
jgi:hypothetical protein